MIDLYICLIGDSLRKAMGYGYVRTTPALVIGGLLGGIDRFRL